MRSKRWHAPALVDTVSTASASFSISKFGRILLLTFEAILNGDLRIMNPSINGVASKDISLRKQKVCDAFHAKMPDGKALFHASRENLITTKIEQVALKKFRLKLSMAKDLYGDPMDLELANIVCFPEDRDDWQKLISPITATITSNVNVYAGKFQLISDPMLKKGEFIGAKDPAYGDAIELADLRSFEGVRVEELPNQMIDGIG